MSGCMGFLLLLLRRQSIRNVFRTGLQPNPMSSEKLKQLVGHAKLLNQKGLISNGDAIRLPDELYK